MVPHLQQHQSIGCIPRKASEANSMTAKELADEMAMSAGRLHFGDLPMCAPSVKYLANEILEAIPVVDMIEVIQAANRFKAANDYVEAAQQEANLRVALDRLIARGVKL